MSYFNGTYIETEIELETCELGKNIDTKFENLTEDLFKIGRTVNQFHCINSKYGNLPLFHNPQIGYSSIYVFPVLDKNSNYIPEQLQSLIGSEINILNHDIKKNPIKETYWLQITNNFQSSQFTIINYNFQYIKYESDEGLFFKKSKISNGISFSDMTFFNNIMEDFNLQKNFEYFNKSKIGAIVFEINKAHFDYYKRTYQKLQSLLAEIMSVVNLLFETGKQISYILLDKKMSKDIINSVICNDKNEIKKINRHNKNKNNINNIFNKNIKNKKITEEFENKSNSKKNISKNDLKLSENLENKEQKDEEKMNTTILNNINYFHILQSFICPKNKRSKLINYLYDIINKNLSIEKIFEKFYKIEIMYSLLAGEKINKIKRKKLKEINKRIYEISNNA